MIPAILPALKLVPWRGVGVGLACLGLIVLGWRVHTWRDAYKAYPALEERLAAEEACEAPSKCSKRVAALVERQKVVSATVVQGYEDEIKSLRDRPVSVRTVRLCPDARAGRVPGAGPAAGPDGAGAPSGELHGSPQPDIGPDLYQLARDADEIAARLRGLQQWNKALAGAE